MSPELTAAITNLKEKGEALAQARSEEQRLEDERPLLKELAIIRIMARDGSAATRAEKIVESDQEYMAHRIAQRGSVVARFKADAEYWAAKCEATQASLITPDVLALESEINEVAEANRSLFLSQNETREANAELVQANRELAEQNALANDTIDHLNDRIAELQSRLTHNPSITMNLTPINAEATP